MRRIEVDIDKAVTALQEKLAAFERTRVGLEADIKAAILSLSRSLAGLRSGRVRPRRASTIRICDGRHLAFCVRRLKNLPCIRRHDI